MPRVISKCRGVVSEADPGLGPLQINTPGSTPTMEIGPLSAAYNTADAATALAMDQRGVSRPQGGAYDIGAYESVPPYCRFSARIDRAGQRAAGRQRLGNGDNSVAERVQRSGEIPALGGPGGDLSLVRAGFRHAGG